MKSKPKQFLQPIREEEVISKNQYEFKEEKSRLQKSREHARVQVTIGLSVASDWLRKEQEFSAPITERGEVNLGLFSTLDRKLRQMG